MDAEQAGHAGGDGRSGRGDCLRHPLARIRDECRQEAGGTETSMGGADGGDPLHRRLIVEQDSAAAIHLNVDEARRQQAFDRHTPLARRIALGNERR